MTVVLLVVWGSVTIMLLIVASMEYNDAYSDDDRKYFARMILAAPFWPVAATYLFLRYVPTMAGRTIARLMYDATRT